MGCLVVVFAALLCLCVHCICSTLVPVCAMKGIPIGPLAQWGKAFTYYLTPFFFLVNWDMHYPGSACRGTDLPSGRLLYIYTVYIYIFIYIWGEEWLGFPDLWFGKKSWWNWYLTPVVNFGEVRRSKLAKSTLLTSTLVFLGSFQIF